MEKFVSPTEKEHSSSRTDSNERFRLIESVCFFGSRLTSIHLQKVFGIGRIQASRDINRYKRLHPDNIVYDTTLRGYRKSQAFRCYYSDNSLEEYAYFNQRLRMYYPEENLCDELFTFGKPLISYQGEDVRAFIDAIQKRQLMLIKTEKGQFRFAPHTLVIEQVGVSLRGFNHSSKSYESHNIESLLGSFSIVGIADREVREDRLWNQLVTIELKNRKTPRLTEKTIPLAVVPLYCELLNLGVSKEVLKELALEQKEQQKLKQLLTPYLDQKDKTSIQIKPLVSS